MSDSDLIEQDEQKSSDLKQVEYKRWGNLSRAVLNGVIGDYLVKQENPLAIDMGFYHDGKPLSLPNREISMSNKVVTMLHGLTNLETIWDIPAKPISPNEDDVEVPEEVLNYGVHLQKDFGYTPIFLRYNTGLNIEQNGKDFAKLMDRFVSAYPKPIDEIIFVGFSMGGLLMRYAQKDAIESGGSTWLPLLKQCFYIGTPHEGSYFERFGHLVSSVVRAVPRDYINHWADWIDVRSEGIQDLKHGLAHLQNAEGASEPAAQRDVDEREEEGETCGSFYQEATHHFISGSLLEEADSLVNKVFGDALVNHSSANPVSAPPNSKYAHFDGIPHVPLAHTEQVYQQIKQWLDESAEQVKLVEYHEDEIDFDSTGPALIVASGMGTGDVSTPSQQEMVAGALDLIAVGYDKTVEAIEKVHLSIAKEPHEVLKYVPVVESVSGVVDSTHSGVAEAVYKSVKQGGGLIRAAAAILKNVPGKSEEGRKRDNL